MGYSSLFGIALGLSSALCGPTSVQGPEGYKPAAAGLDSDRFAIVIGVDDPHALALDTGIRVKPLSWAASDAKRIGASLGEMGWHVKLLVSPEETRAESIHRALSALECTPDDTVLVYYAGHGFELDTTAYLTSSVTKFVPDVKAPGTWMADESSLLSFGSLNRSLDVAKAMRRIYIVDACREDARQAGVVMDTSGTLDVGKRTGIPAGVVKVSNKAEGLNELARERVSTVALMSCSRKESSYEVGGAGIFTASFLEALRAAKQRSLGEPVGVEGLGALVQARINPRADYLGKTMTVRVMGDFAGQMPLFESPVGPEVLNLAGEAKPSVSMRDLLGAFTRAFRYQLAALAPAPVDLTKKMPASDSTYVDFLKGEPDETLRLAVMTLLSRGIEPGLFDVTSGSSKATRYHAAWLVWQLNQRLGNTVSGSGHVPPDVPPDHWSYEAVRNLPLLGEGDMETVMNSLAARLSRLGLDSELVDKVQASVRSNFTTVYVDGLFRGSRPVFSTEAMGFILGYYEAASRVEEQKAEAINEQINQIREQIEVYRHGLYKDSKEKYSARDKMVGPIRDWLRSANYGVEEIHFRIGLRNNLNATLAKLAEEVKEFEGEIGEPEPFTLRKSDLRLIREGEYILGNSTAGEAISLSDMIHRVRFSEREVILHVAAARRFAVSYLASLPDDSEKLAVAPWPQGLRLESRGPFSKKEIAIRNETQVAFPADGQLWMSVFGAVGRATVALRPVSGWIDRERSCERAVVGFEGVESNAFLLIECMP